MLQGGRTDVQRRENWRHRMRNLALTLGALLVVVYVSGVVHDSSNGNSDELSPQRDSSATARSRDGANATNRTVDTIRDSLLWKTKAEQVAKALTRLRESPDKETQSAPLASSLETLTNRLELVSRFLKSHEASLSTPVEPGSPLATEIDQLVEEAEQYRRSPNRSAAAPNLPDRAVLLTELDARIAQADRHFQDDIQTKAAEEFAPTRQQLQEEITRLQYETRDIAEKTELARQKIEAEVREREDDLARLQRQRALERDLAEVRRLLCPFISPGHVQPNSSVWDRIRTVESEPVSLGRLGNIGALKPTMKGLESLYTFGARSDAGINDRPPGAFPEYAANGLSKAHILEAVKRAQELLRVHGAALVEQKMLSP